MGYGTVMVPSVVIISNLMDHRQNAPEETKKSAGKERKETDFEAILRQAMKW